MEQAASTFFKEILRAFLPMFSCLFLLFFAVIPLPLPFMTFTPLQILYIGIFYWAIFAPQRIYYSFLFLLGILQDCLFSTPLGISSLFFVSLFFFIRHRRHYFLQKTFLTHWFIFSIIVFAACLFMWLFMSALNGTFFQPFALFFQMIMTIAFYPIWAWIMSYIRLE